jgi:hypothetical protein
MQVSRAGGHPAARSAVQETVLYQVRLVYILYGVTFFTNGSGKGVKPDRPTGKFVDDGQHDQPVHGIESHLVDFQATGRPAQPALLSRHRREPARNPAPGAAVGDRGVPLLRRAISNEQILLYVDAQNAGGTGHNHRELIFSILRAEMTPNDRAARGKSPARVIAPTR